MLIALVVVALVAWLLVRFFPGAITVLPNTAAKPDRSADGWFADIARASILVPVWAGEIGFTIVLAVFLSWLALIPFLLAVFLGPFPAAWVACQVWPAERRRMKRMAMGALIGLFFSFLAISAIVKSVPPGHSASTENSAIAAVVAVAVMMPWIGAVWFARWDQAPKQVRN